jgi:hypothetical protein
MDIREEVAVEEDDGKDDGEDDVRVTAGTVRVTARTGLPSWLASRVSLEEQVAL